MGILHLKSEHESNDAQPDAPPPGMRDVSVLPQMAFADEDDEPTGVLGTLKEMPVSEVVQSLGQGMKDALIEVKPKGEPLGVIGMERGRVVYAQTDALSGEAAFFKLFCAHRGAFRIRYGRRPEAHNIDRDPTYLLLEGARLLDEERAYHPVFDTPPDGTPFVPPRALAPIAEDAFKGLEANESAERSAAESLPRTTTPFSGFFHEAGVKTPPPNPSLPPEAQRFQSLHLLEAQEAIIDDVDHIDSDRTTRERKPGPVALTDAR